LEAHLRKPAAKIILRGVKRLAANPTWDNFMTLKWACIKDDATPCGRRRLENSDCYAIGCPLFRKPYGFSNYCNLICFPGGFATGKNARKRQERSLWEGWKGELVLEIHKFLAWREL